MMVEVRLTHNHISAPPPLPEEVAGQCGATVIFNGEVRSEENGCPIAAIEYEAYPAMAVKMMEELLRSLSTRHACSYARVVHRTGVVAVGEAAIQIVVAAKHRGPAFAMTMAFMDALKQQVPIWKCRVLALEQQALPQHATP